MRFSSFRIHATRVRHAHVRNKRKIHPAAVFGSAGPRARSETRPRFSTTKSVSRRRDNTVYFYFLLRGTVMRRSRLGRAFDTQKHIPRRRFS